MILVQLFEALMKNYEKDDYFIAILSFTCAIMGAALLISIPCFWPLILLDFIVSAVSDQKDKEVEG